VVTEKLISEKHVLHALLIYEKNVVLFAETEKKKFEKNVIMESIIDMTENVLSNVKRLKQNVEIEM
jgi:hypothetical protein